MSNLSPTQRLNNFANKLLRASDIARILNISSSMVYRLIQTNEIASVHIGSAVRVREDDLDAYIASHLNHAK